MKKDPPEELSGRWAKAWTSSPASSQMKFEPSPPRKADWKDAFTPQFYYEQTRKEIEREDNITHQRLTWAISMQSFLVAAVALLVSGAWPGLTDISRLFVFREILVGGLGLVGIFSSFITLRGVQASRRHLDRVKANWHAFNDALGDEKIVPEMAPHIFGDQQDSFFGGAFAKRIPAAMLVAWSLYFITYVVTIGCLLPSHIEQVVQSASRPSSH